MYAPDVVLLEKIETWAIANGLKRGKAIWELCRRGLASEPMPVTPVQDDKIVDVIDPDKQAS
jgi:hypothetical protein